MSSIKLRDLLSEVPQSGHYFGFGDAEKLDNLISQHIKSERMHPFITKRTLSDTTWIAWGGINGKSFDVWLGIFQGIDMLVFGMILQQIPGGINGAPTYQVTRANKYYANVGKKLEKQALLTFLEDNTDLQIASDEKVSDAAKKVWIDIVTDPTLKDRTFFWNTKTKSVMTPETPEDVFGTEPDHRDVVCVLRPKKLTEYTRPNLPI